MFKRAHQEYTPQTLFTPLCHFVSFILRLLLIHSTHFSSALFIITILASKIVCISLESKQASKQASHEASKWKKGRHLYICSHRCVTAFPVQQLQLNQIQPNFFVRLFFCCCVFGHMCHCAVRQSKCMIFFVSFYKNESDFLFLCDWFQFYHHSRSSVLYCIILKWSL